ncbi:uncharacterized protein LOC114972319 [Acropora millepora]|uniref:uncharacterized protein LOC114972319 n=1 Tax=Acropora millepora TaxID=45264 RepID=UPI001CF37BE8|nr:uncharacterized protein LOC114972319 [Acropora millepora]
MVATRHCCWGKCNNDSRYPERLPDSLKEMLKNGQKAFIPFPKPKHDLELRQRWVNACSRQNFSVKNVNYNTYICAVHWPGGKGPTKEFPDPFKANLSEKEVRNKTQVKRKAPKQRHEAVAKKARKQLKANSEVESPDVLSENDSSLYDFKDEEPPTRDQSTQTLSNAELKSKIETLITSNALKTITPNGGSCFVSDLYEGDISDVQIFEQSGILKHIEPQDVILVDRGFTVQDLVNPLQACIQIPAFLKGRGNLSAAEELSTRKIAKARVHVERFNQRLKQFKLVGRTIPLSLAPLATQMVVVACGLVNFQEVLCK